MNFKSLKVFCDIVGRRSFSQAAADNGITQSGASQIVHQLEDSLGVRLIDRSKRPFDLTPEGQVYYEGCRGLVQRLQSLQEEVRSLHQRVQGRVSVASIYSVGLSYGKRLTEQSTERFPNASVAIEYHHPDRVYELVAENRVDLGLVSYPRTTRTVQATDWLHEPMILVCTPQHWLATRVCVGVEEINGLVIIGFDRDLKIRRSIDRQLAERGVEVRVSIAFDNIDTIKHAIAVNGGASWLPQPTVEKELQAGELIRVGVDGFQLVRPLGIIVRRGTELGITAQRFLQFLGEARPADRSLRGVGSAARAPA